MDKNTAFDVASRYYHYLKDNNFAVEKAVLFGSYARGDFDDNSDIDLALVFKKLDNKFKMQVQLLMLTHKFDTRIEPHPIEEEDYNNGNSLAYEILRSGVILQ
jgi:uncharacterized protein